jgi:YegS/Rv2252/BmrU family lipid kinase
LAQQAIHESYHKLISVGGDGTHSEVVSGIMQSRETCDRVLLGVVPAGTGNDFCRNLTSCSIEALCTMETGCPIDLIQAEYTDADGSQKKRISLNIAEFGILADLVRNYNTTQQRLSSGRKWPYITSYLQVIKNLSCWPIRLQFDDELEWITSATVVSVANGSYFGNGIRIAPYARINDQKLDVTVLGKLGRIGLSLALLKAMRGKPLAHSQIHYRQAKAMVAAAQDPQAKIPFEVDGEWLGFLPCRFRVLPSAISLINPLAIHATGDS